MNLPTGPGIIGDLRARILSLDLPPGAPLSRADLSARYGISSTPLRDALLRLQDEGLVQIHPHARTSVSRIDLDLARQTHFLRSAVEVEIAAKLAARPPAGLADELWQLIDMQAVEAAEDRLKAFGTLDQAFHDALFRHAGLMQVQRMIRRESIHIDRLRALHLMQPEKARQILSDHRSIAQAIGKGDPAGAAQAMRQHLSQSILFGERLTAQDPQYFTSAAR
ncbi:GntR family transcriptional regulator [Paracoccus liaowanqingii]|uniref:GntR family transcriptional regulator n=1 Tax=Paracoccus liaowanqingii TaxID=2560053 RepID=A0A4Z1CQT5_9RHOB|nr:GntR family transcriptional regulator [Paracoccus liaowanqingii]TGN67469.1 GntR family transcriptional regulator [Paracoccus liaowanqingii]